MVSLLRAGGFAVSRGPPPAGLPAPAGAAQALPPAVWSAACVTRRLAASRRLD
jgi:hypothetical protein